MSYVRTSGHPLTPRHQTDASIVQANPVSGTIYPVLSVAGYVRIISISANVEWTVQPTPLQMHITIDGQTWYWSKDNPISATQYEAGIMAPASVNQDVGAWGTATGSRAFLLEGRNVTISAETTGGTVQNLICRVKYAKY